MPRQYTRIPISIRLWRHVAKTPDHWLWTGALDHRGYGKIGQDGKTLATHRVAWELANGTAVPEGVDVLHTCDIPACLRNDEQGTYEVNGELLPRWGHLFIGTDALNKADMFAKSRHAHGDSHSFRQHPERILRGHVHPMAKLGVADVQAIRKLSHDGVTGRQLALAYKVSPATICLILSRKLWKHVE